MDVVQERLEREYGISMLLTFPSVELSFRSQTTARSLCINNPPYYPDPTSIAKGEEPYIKATIMMPERYMGEVMTFAWNGAARIPGSTTPAPIA